MFYKYKNHLCLITVFIFLLSGQYSCKKRNGYNDIISKDKSRPEPVTNVKVTNFSGGAYITYSLPKSENVLYVQAQYMINDHVSRQTKASYYSDTLTVSGFAESKDYKVTLHTVSRANIKSDSVTVTVHPDIPPYRLVYPTLSIQKSFGGGNITAQNEKKAAIGIVTILPDSITGKWEVVNQLYTNQESISFNLRGYDTLARKFGMYVTDQWGNLSDTLFKTIHPLFETKMDKSKFQPYSLPSDVPSYSAGYGLTNMWDNSLGEPIFASKHPAAKWPIWITFDLGQTVKLSRYNIVGRTSLRIYYWTTGTPQTWVIWGRPDKPVDEMMPADTTGLPPVGESTPAGWINLGVFHAPPKPSGLPLNQFTNEDIAVFDAGFDYDFSLALPKVRYIRFQCLENMVHTNDYFGISELAFWGDPR